MTQETEVPPHEQARRDFIAQFELKSDKPGFHGPMVHKVTGESYQGMLARVEHEYQQRKKNSK
jgi:hypothetical protein